MSSGSTTVAGDYRTAPRVRYSRTLAVRLRVSVSTRRVLTDDAAAAPRPASRQPRAQCLLFRGYQSLDRLAAAPERDADHGAASAPDLARRRICGAPSSTWPRCPTRLAGIPKARLAPQEPSSKRVGLLISGRAGDAAPARRRVAGYLYAINATPARWPGDALS